MTIAVSEEHEALRLTAQRWLAAHCPPSEPRAAAEGPTATLPPVWEKMASQGWLGLHLSEEAGGQGFGLVELAVVLEELGAALFPGPLLPRCWPRPCWAAVGGAREREDLLPGLADGSLTAAVALGRGGLDAEPAARGALRISGAVRPVLGLPEARVLLAAGRYRAMAARRPRRARRRRPGGDPHRAGRHPARLSRSPSTASSYRRPSRSSPPTSSSGASALALGSAESAGIARWCLDTASEYAKVRVQFGRPIGQFQAVKHALADMLVAVEQCAAVAWDAASAWSEEDGADASGGARLAACIAGSVALPAAARCAKQCVQTLGGIGFTWEHDAHLYLKRAVSEPAAAGGRGCRRARKGGRPRWPSPAPVASSRRSCPRRRKSLRADVRRLVEQVAETPEGPERREALAEAGLIMPHWPAPWGRGSSPAGAARHRRGAGPRRRVASPPRRGRLGPPHPHRARDR